jgi:hypothetical protein
VCHVLVFLQGTASQTNVQHIQAVEITYYCKNQKIWESCLVQNRTFRFFVGSGLWTQPHKWLILAHSSHPSIAGAMSPAEVDLLAWVLWGREGILLPGMCAIASKNAHLCRFDVLAHFFRIGKSRFQSGGWLPKLAMCCAPLQTGVKNCLPNTFW